MLYRAKHRLFAAALALCIFALLLPATPAKAAPATGSLWIGGVEVVSDLSSLSISGNGANGGSWSWSATNGLLYLDEYNGGQIEIRCAADDYVVVSCTGNVVISASPGADAALYCAGSLAVADQVTISTNVVINEDGNARAGIKVDGLFLQINFLSTSNSLSSHGAQYGIQCAYLTLRDGTISATTGGTSDASAIYAGIYAKGGAVSIQGDGSVLTVGRKGAGLHAYGIYANDGINIWEKPNVDAAGFGSGYALYAYSPPNEPSAPASIDISSGRVRLRHNGHTNYHSSYFNVQDTATVLFDDAVTPPTITSVTPSGMFLTAGMTISLTGSGFNKLTRLTLGAFDLSPADYTIISDTALTFTVPAEAVYSISITLYTTDGIAPRYSIFSPNFPPPAPITGSLWIGGIEVLNDLRQNSNGGSMEDGFWLWHADTGGTLTLIDYKGKHIDIRCNAEATVTVLYSSTESTIINADAGVPAALRCTGHLQLYSGNRSSTDIIINPNGNAAIGIDVAGMLILRGGMSPTTSCTIYGSQYGVKCGDNLTISGFVSGTNITAMTTGTAPAGEVAAGIYCPDATLYIEREAVVKAGGTGANTYGIYADSINVDSAATLEAQGSGTGYGIDGQLFLENNSLARLKHLTPSRYYNHNRQIINYNSTVLFGDATVAPTITGVTPSGVYLTAGSKVTVTGTGFLNTVHVLLDIFEAPFTVISDTELTFTTPADGAGAYHLYLYTEEGMVMQNAAFTSTRPPSNTGGITSGSGGSLTVPYRAVNAASGGNTATFSGSEDISFTINASLSLLKDVKYKGVALTRGVDYTAHAGSTVITFSTSYLHTLGTGTHAFTVHFTNGRTATLTIAVDDILLTTDEEIVLLPPKTGERPALIGVVILVFVAFGVIALRRRAKR